uniref:DDE Tnp4 domain-containing protein n=1 Tax=Fagus sylvatica TaxID=28930 RepID=A0A2N9ENL5_FAGSY
MFQVIQEDEPSPLDWVEACPKCIQLNLLAETHSSRPRSARLHHLQTVGIGTARLGGRLYDCDGGSCFAAWPAGWVSPSRRGQRGGSLLRGVASGVGLSLVVAGLTGGGGYRSEKRATPWVSPWWWLASQEMEMALLESDSDDEIEILSIFAMEEERLKREQASTSRRGSIVGRKVIKRDYLQGEERLFHDYFVDNPVFPPHLFRRRFRMSRPLFFHLQSALEAHDPYFIQKRNAAGTLGLSSLQKMTAAVRILAYGVAADSTDEYVRIGESTTIESLKRFVKAVVNIFSEEYLRSPNSNDIARLLAVNEKRGFPGMLGSIDCMHWKWKNCPTTWKGQYTGHSREPTLILEAVASYDRWIWHAFFGLPGSHNDINVLEHSSIFTELV